MHYYLTNRNLTSSDSIRFVFFCLADNMKLAIVKRIVDLFVLTPCFRDICNIRVALAITRLILLGVFRSFYCD